MHKYKKGDVVQVVVDPVNHPDSKYIFNATFSKDIPLKLWCLYKVTDVSEENVYINCWWVTPAAISYPLQVEEELD